MKTNKWLWGIFFVCAAALVIAYQFGNFLETNLFGLVITILLIPVIIGSLAHLNFVGVFFPLAFLAIIYDDQLNITQLTPWPVLVSALFLSVGFSLLFHKKNHWRVYHKHEFEHDTVEYIEDSDTNCHVSFGSSSKYLRSDSLKQASLSCSFGELKVFFDDAQLHPEGADIFVDCSFGNIELYIPKTWQVIDRVSVTLGNVDDRNRRGDGTGPVLTLKGRVNLGNISIIYI